MNRSGKESAIMALAKRPIWQLVPTLGFLLIVFLLPVSALLLLSIKGVDGRLTSEHFGRLFESSIYFNVLFSTLKIASWTTILCLIGAYPVAYLLATVANDRRGFILVAILVPFWTSFLVRTLAWIVVLGRRGVVNQTLVQSGLVDNPIQFIFNFYGVMVGLCHAMIPLCILTIYSVMSGIDPALSRAGATLGARPAQVFWRVYFPLSVPGVAAAGLLTFVSALGFFITPQLLGSPRETMVAQLIIVQIEEMLNWSFAAAIAVLLFGTSALVFFVFDRVIGMEALTGQQGTRGAAPGAFVRLIRLFGMKLVAGISWICAGAGYLIDRLKPRGTRRKREHRSRPVLALVAISVLAFLLVPMLFLIPISFTESAFLEWPPRGFTTKWYEGLFSSPVWIGAASRSVWVGLATSVLSVLIAMPAALFLVRQPLRAKSAVMALIITPVVLPHIIVALALFYAYSYVGLVGTSVGLVLGHLVFSLPYAIVSLMAVLKVYDHRLDYAAWSLGANKFETLRYITLPVIKTGVVTAFLFAFVKSFDELTVALFVTGGTFSTLPKQIWTEALYRVTPTLAAVSTILLIVVAVIVVGADFLSRSGRRRPG